MMKLFTTLLLLITLTVARAQQKASLSGTYRLDTAKTGFAGVPRWTLPVALTVLYEGGKLTIVRRVSDQDGNQSDRTLAFGEGTTASYHSPGGAQNKASFIWNADHAGLVLNQISTDASGNPGLSFKEIWSLAADDKTLVVRRHVEQPDGLKYDIRAYYVKPSN